MTDHRSAVRAVELTKHYGGKVGVDGLALEVPRGELFGFLGPNGSGKTTTIKMLTGLLSPTSGVAEICGIEIWRDPLAAKARLAYVPDQPNLFPKLTGWEFLQFVASVFRMPAETFRARAGELLELFGLTADANALTETYSHGMRQKLALTAGLLHAPDVIFLDEPTVGLDPRSARVLKTLLRRFCDDGGTVFLTTHILEIAERTCDRIGIIHHGHLIALGTIEELRRGRGTIETSASLSLEDIFLELTGGAESAELVAALSDSAR